MTRQTIYRPCPDCLPGATADYDYHSTQADGSRVYQCRNCGHEQVVKSRPLAPSGGAKQALVVEAVLEAIKLDNYTFEVEKVEGEVRIKLHPIKSYDHGGVVFIGPRGALKLTRFEGGGKTITVKGRQVWSVLEVYFGM